MPFYIPLPLPQKGELVLTLLLERVHAHSHLGKGELVFTLLLERVRFMPHLGRRGQHAYTPGARGQSDQKQQRLVLPLAPGLFRTCPSSEITEKGTGRIERPAW
jgi:hypothetical protein